MRVCRCCYALVTVRVQPGRGFVCRWCEPDQKCRRERKLAKAKKERQERALHSESQ